MENIVISAKRIRKERNFYLLSFGISFLINLMAVVRFDRPWSELFSQIGYVVVISIFVYLLLWIPRLLVIGLQRLFCKKQ